MGRNEYNEPMKNKKKTQEIEPILQHTAFEGAQIAFHTQDEGLHVIGTNCVGASLTSFAPEMVHALIVAEAAFMDYGIEVPKAVANMMDEIFPPCLPKKKKARGKTRANKRQTKSS